MGPSKRDTGRRFRKAVEHELGQGGQVATAPDADWTVYNGTRVAIRYSRCEARTELSKWFYGIERGDTEELGADGALALVMPHPEGHRFALLDQDQTRELLSRCRGSERGTLKIHLRYDDPSDVYSIREWMDFDLVNRVFSLGAGALAAAGITNEMGFVYFDDAVVAEDGEHEGASTASTLAQGRRPGTMPARKPRAFDPRRVPTLKASGHSIAPELTLARREQASQAHQRLVAALDDHLRRAGWSEIAELAGAIDLWARRPSDQRRVIFECKSLALERPAAELARCRTGLAQLLEYRFEYGGPGDQLCLVTDGPLHVRRVRILESVGVACIVVRGRDVEFAGRLAGDIMR
jgi:hypothetical protein